MCNTKVFIAYRDGLTVVGNYSLVVAKTRKALNCQKLRVENMTLGIYYTNKSPVSTIIWLNFATKLCQRRGTFCGPKSTTAPRSIWQSFFFVLRLGFPRPSSLGRGRERFFRQFSLLVRVEPRKHVKRLAGPDYTEESERVPNYFAGLQTRRRGRLRAKKQAQFTRRDGFQLGQVVVVGFASEANRHLPQRFYAVGIVTVVGRTDLAPADTVVNNLLLVLEISEIGANYRTKFLIGTLGIHRRSKSDD